MASATDQERCKHGLKQQFYGICLKSERGNTKPLATRISPEPRSDKTNPPGDGRFLAISNKDLAHLDKYPKNATHIHLNGPIYPKAIRALLDYFPQLQILNFMPCIQNYQPAKTLEKCREILSARGAALQFEYVLGREARVTIEDLMTAPHWRALRSLALNLNPEQRAKLDELVALEFKQAEMFKRYYLIDCPEENRITLADVAKALGSSNYQSGYFAIKTVFYYLGLQGNGSASAQIKQFAETLARRVEEKKKALAAESAT